MTVFVLVVFNISSFLDRWLFLNWRLCLKVYLFFFCIYWRFFMDDRFYIVNYFFSWWGFAVAVCFWISLCYCVGEYLSFLRFGIDDGFGVSWCFYIMTVLINVIVFEWIVIFPLMTFYDRWRFWVEISFYMNVCFCFDYFLIFQAIWQLNYFYIDRCAYICCCLYW